RNENLRRLGRADVGRGNSFPVRHGPEGRERYPARAGSTIGSGSSAVADGGGAADSRSAKPAGLVFATGASTSGGTSAARRTKERRSSDRCPKGTEVRGRKNRR